MTFAYPFIPLFAIGVIAAQSSTAIGLGLAVVPLALMFLSLQLVKEPTA
jgi:Na+/phosphate symporter